MKKHYVEAKCLDEEVLFLFPIPVFLLGVSAEMTH